MTIVTWTIGMLGSIYPNGPPTRGTTMLLQLVQGSSSSNYGIHKLWREEERQEPGLCVLLLPPRTCTEQRCHPCDPMTSRNPPGCLSSATLSLCAQPNKTQSQNDHHAKAADPPRQGRANSRCSNGVNPTGGPVSPPIRPSGATYFLPVSGCHALA